jgi:uncharacterized protein (DUF2147 family)
MFSFGNRSGGSLRNQSRRALLLALASILALSSLLSVQTVSATDSQGGNQGPYGYWKSVDKKTGRLQSIFTLYDDKGKLTGKIVKIFPKPGEEHDPICHKCDGSRKDQPKIGIVFFWNFTPVMGKSNKWESGQILNPDDGKVYKSEATLSEDGKSLSVYGYIRIIFKIGGTSVWERPTAAELQGI